MPGLTTAFAQGTHAARAAAALANKGYYYYETDTGGLFQSTGATWVQVAAASTLSTATQSANTVFSGPTSGGAVIPAFRALVAADIPTIPVSQVSNVGVSFSTVVGGGWTIGSSAVTKMFLATGGGVSFSDITTGATTTAGANITVGAVNDSCYIGSTATGPGVWFQFTEGNGGAGGTGTYTTVLEYWNGSSWLALPASSNLGDNTVLPGSYSFSSAGHSLGFMPPSDWAVTTVNSVSAWWLRSRCTAFTSQATPPQLKSCTLSRLSDATNTSINGVLPGHGLITSFVVAATNFNTNNSYGILDFTTGAYGLLSGTPSASAVTGLSIGPLGTTGANNPFGILNVGSNGSFLTTAACQLSMRLT